MITEFTRNEIVLHANECAPKESCGLIVNISGKERYIKCRNISGDDGNFILHPEDYMDAEDRGQIVAIVHSHPNSSPSPSEADLVSCESSGLPWIIYSLSMNLFQSFTPSGYEAPLMGRTYSYGVLDCYSLIRDWYRKEMGIVLPEFDRPHGWWNEGKNLYVDNLRVQGFGVIDSSEIQRGDLILMQIGTTVPAHGGIYLGNDRFIHHQTNRLSCEEVYDGYWRKTTRLIARYGSPL